MLYLYNKIAFYITLPEKEVKINGGYAGLALSMKIWPERGSAQELISTEFNLLLDELIDGHCI